MPQDKNSPRPTLAQRIERFLTTFLSTAFGNLSYSPPPWMKRIFAKLSPFFDIFRRVWTNASTRALEEKRANPKRFWIKSGSMAAGLVVIIAGIIYYNNRPQPYLIDVTGSTPQATPLNDYAKPEPLYINFSNAAARLDLVDKVVIKEIHISPLIQGEWRWTTDRQLKFTPSQDWAIDESYKVSFDRGLFAQHAKLRKYSYEFNSASFSYSISDASFYQDPKVAADKKITATIRFSHPVNTGDFEKRISLEMKEKDAQGAEVRKRSIPFKVTYDKWKGEAYILTERISLPASDSPVNLTIAKGVRSERGGNNVKDSQVREVTVPGLLSFFRVNSIEPTIVRNEKYEPEQVIVVNTTATASQEEIDKNFVAYLLPIDRPATPGLKPQEKHYWNATEVGPEILKVSEKLKLEAIPTELEYADTHTYRFNAPVGRTIYAKLAKGTKAFGDYVLAKESDTVFRVPNFPKELNIMSEGALLSMSGKKKISIIARGIKDIQLEVGRVMGSQINHLISQGEGSYSNPVFREYQFSADSIVERFSEVRTLASDDAQKAQYTAFDFNPYLTKGNPSAKRGLFLFKVTKWDPVNKRAQEPEDHRLILVTDLGVIAKHNQDGTFDVFVQSIATGRPVPGAAVEVLGKNGLPVITQTTNAEGKAHIPDLKSFEREKMPIAFVARLGNDFSFLPYQRYDRQLNYSGFDVGGIYQNQSEGLTGYLFSDRGIYRPGEEAKIGVIVKSTDWRKHVEFPLEAIIYDPRGMEVFKKKFNIGKEGIDELTFPTLETFLTGTYQISLYIVKDKNDRAVIGNSTIRVEEFEPDKLRITAHLSQEKREGWISPDKLTANISLQTLFGFPAADRKVQGEIELVPAPPVFKKFADFKFYDPSKTDKSFSESLGETTTDKDGKASFSLNLERFEKATYRLRFFVEGFESEGGRGVGTESYALISPLAHLVGFRTDGETNFLTKDSARHVDLIAVDSSLVQKKVDKLKLAHVEIKYVSSLIKQPNGTYRYQSVKKENTLDTKPFEIAAAGTKLALNTTTPGEFAYLIKDEEGTILNRVEYSVSGTANLTRSLEKSSRLQLKLSQSDYGPGEEIEMNIVAPYTGAGLVTIERDKVYAHSWFKTSTTSSVQKIRVPQGLEGNAYVNVTFVRGLDSKEIYTSPLSYAVAPFSISRDRRKHKIDLAVPQKVIPGETLKMKVKVDRPAKLVVFAVDEGILQVARYQNPDPLSFFFQKKMLQVTTSQIVDMILPEIDMIDQESASGGGEGALLAKNLNPFRRRKDKAVAYWSGLIDVGTDWKELSYQVPDSFNGTMRVIALAVSGEKMGVSVDSSIIRGPFVISPTVPFFVAPGDEFQISAAVANDVEGSGKDASVVVSLSTTGELEIIGEGKQAVKIAEKSEQPVRFKLKAKERLGSATLKFTAEYKNAKIVRSTDISVRPSTHFQTVVHAGSMDGGKGKDVALNRKLFGNLRNASVMVGHLPLGYAGGLLNYLSTYPYGCTEQQVSRAFPAVALKKFPEFGNNPAKIQQILDDVTAVVRSRQNEEGAFGFWAANSYTMPELTTYVAHFLTDTKEAGFPIPEDVLNRAMGNLSQITQGDLSTLSNQRVAAYATYLLLRNGNMASRALTNLYERFNAQKDKAWQTDTTAVWLAGAYALSQDKTKAYELIKRFKVGQSKEYDYEHFHDPLVRDTQYLYVLAKHFPDRLKDMPAAEIETAFGPIAQGNYNTINSSYSILALTAMAERIPESPALKVTLTELLENGSSRPLTFQATRFPKAEYSEGATKIKINNGAERALFYSVTEGGFDKKAPEKEAANGVEVTREFVNEAGNAVTDSKLGEEITVKLAVRAIKNPVWNAAVVDLLPGGFEVVRDSIRKPTPSASNGEGEPSPRGEEGGGEGEGDYIPPPMEGEEGEGAMWIPNMKNLFGIPDAIADGENDWTPDYADIREDRVILYGSIGDSAKIYSYRIKATNEGKFVIPAIYAEGMYDRSVKANSKGGTTFTVK